MDQKIKLERALAKAAEFLGKPLEVPDESAEDLMREAQSVLNYFEVKGEQFKRIPCRQCGLIFAYSYHYDGVKYCSISCIKRALQAIGLRWNPATPVKERWGRFVPAVVPPAALEIVEHILHSDTQEDEHHNTSYE